MTNEKGCICWFCGTELQWKCDYTPEDFGMEGDGIVSILTCPKCGTEAQFTLIRDKEQQSYNKGTTIPVLWQTMARDRNSF